MLLLFILGITFLAYYIVLNLTEPLSPLHSLFSFNSAFLFLAIVSFTLFILLKKHLLQRIWGKTSLSIKVTVLVPLATLLIILIINLLLITNNSPYSPTLPSDVKVLILLGGGMNDRGQPSKNAMFRVKKAATLLKTYPNLTCIATGGKPLFSPISEGEAMKKVLVTECGIESKRVLVENSARNTIENFSYSIILLENAFDNKDIRSFPTVIVTQDFHIKRSLFLASREGFTNIFPAPCKTPPLNIPSSYFRETLAYIKLAFIHPPIYQKGRSERLTL